MTFFKALSSWDAKTVAGIGVNQELIDLQAKRMRLLFESLQKEGFSEDQALQIVRSMAISPGAQPGWK